MKKDHNPEINNPIPVDKLYDHFSTLHSNSKDETDPNAINFNIGTTCEPTTSDPRNKLDDPISEIEIISTTKKLKTKKAPGLDRIRNEMLKCGIHYLASSLSILFNTILKSGYLPASWSKGMITAIYKSVDKCDPSNYRGICVSSCLSKLFCSILNERLYNFIQERNLLYPSQIEFLPRFRTSDHIISLRTIIDMNVTHTPKSKLFCCFIDLKKAFVSVWHPELFKKLSHYGITGSVYNTKCSIKFGNKRTDYFTYGRGVREGCVLSPLLFNLYLNEISNLLKACNSNDLIILPNGLPFKKVFRYDNCLWTEICENVVLSKIDITMTTRNKKL